MLKLLEEIERIDNEYQYRLEKGVKAESRPNGSVTFRWYEKGRSINSVDSEDLMTFGVFSEMTGLWCSPDRLMTVKLIEGTWIATLYASRRDYNNTIERWKQFNGVKDIRQFLAT